MRSLKRSILLGLVLLGTIASARADIIKGRVVDAQNQPIANAEVLAQSTLGKTYLDKFSKLRADAQGNFSADLQLGKYHNYGQFFAVAPGMSPSSIALKSNSNEKVNVIQLQPAKIISGTVQGHDGKAAADVTVQLRYIYNKSTSLNVFLFRSPWAKRYQTVTDQNGHWLLKAVPAGAQASVRFTDPRYASTEIQASIDKPSITKLDLGATFTGRVVDEAGVPAANVKVTAEAHGNFANSLSWGEATTATNGSYQLTGLSTGAYDIIVDAGERPLVAAAIENKIAHQGKSEKLPDLILTSGGMITGQVLNSKTGKPVTWATIGCYGPQRPRSGSITSADTDAEGRYSLRVAPGKSFVYVAGITPGYILKYNEGFTVAVEKDETVTQDFNVKPGATLSGIVVDRQGKPVANVTVNVTDEMLVKQNVYNQETSWRAITDSEGRWSVQGLTSGIMKVDVAAPWASIETLQVTVPRTGDVRISAEKITDLSPVTRVVDYENKPLAGVKVSLLYKKSATESQSGSATSDANGYVHAKLPDAIESVSLTSATSPGYSFESGGIWNATTETLSDIVLDRLDNTVQGKVFTQQGQPAVDADVWAAGFANAVTQTDKNGAFKLTGLPHQDITLLAVGQNGVSKITLQRGQLASLQLAPLPENNFPSQAQSLDMLEQIYHDTTSKTLYAHNSLAYEIAQYDSQRGLNLLKDDNGKIPGGLIYGVFYLMKEKNPTMALQWGEDHLGDITDDRTTILMLCDLAKLAYPMDKEKAQKYFSEAVKIAQKFSAPEEKTYTDDFQTNSPITQFIYSRAYLAGAAAVVSPDQTSQWVAQTLPYSSDQNDRQAYAWARDVVSQYLGANAPEQTELLVKNSEGRAKATVLKSAIEAAVIAKNSELAERWLNQLLALYKNGDTENSSKFSSGSVYDVGQSVRLVIQVVGPKDSARALQLARMVDDPSQTAQSLMVAAYYQPEQSKLKILKEAFELHWSISSQYLARIAGLVYDISPTQGEVLFDRLLQRYNQQQSDSLTYISQRLNGSNLAYFLARYKPLTSWRILQNEYAKRRMPAQQTGNGYTDVVIAMSVLNFDEAMHWAKGMTSPTGHHFDAQRKLLRLALATPEVRRTLRIKRLGASDTWKPGEPTNW